MEFDFIYVLIGAFVAGVICGLPPLILGILCKRSVPDSKGTTGLVLGIVGFFVCLVCGLILGLLLALPVCIIFTIICAVTLSNGKKRHQQYAQPGQMPYQGQPYQNQQQGQYQPLDQTPPPPYQPPVEGTPPVQPQQQPAQYQPPVEGAPPVQQPNPDGWQPPN